MTILVTNPDYDYATSYLCYYSKEIVSYAKKENIILIQLTNERLRRDIVEGIIRKKDPSFILFNGHGDKNTIYGGKVDGSEEFIIREGFNEGLLKGKLVYARACNSAASLGKKCTEDGIGCFIGYDQPFSFWTDENWVTSPLKDNTARLFLEPSNAIAMSILKGKSAKYAVDKFFQLSKKNIQRLLKDENEPGTFVKAMVLWNNMQAQKILGNSDLTLYY